MRYSFLCYATKKTVDAQFASGKKKTRTLPAANCACKS
uniref:Uncharacterized protein n=1 Tax=Arundo donax TaxID=35708 RepID=A0A0A8YH93_ARUDO